MIFEKRKRMEDLVRVRWIEVLEENGCSPSGFFIYGYNDFIVLWNVATLISSPQHKLLTTISTSFNVVTPQT